MLRAKGANSTEFFPRVVGRCTFRNNYFGRAIASAADPPAVAEFYLNRISSPASAE